MNEFVEVEHVRTVRVRPFDMVLRWSFEPFRSIAIKDSISPLSGSRAWYFYRRGLASSFLSALRVDYPFAFLLANDQTIVSDSATERRSIPWSFAWDTESVVNEGLSVLMNLDRGDVGHYIDGLLGLYPYPATYVLLLSRHKQNLDDVASRLKSLSVGDDWKRALLEVFDVLWLSGEAEYLSIATRDPSLASRLGFMERHGEGT